MGTAPPARCRTQRKHALFCGLFAEAARRIGKRCGVPHTPPQACERCPLVAADGPRQWHANGRTVIMTRSVCLHRRHEGLRLQACCPTTQPHGHMPPHPPNLYMHGGWGGWPSRYLVAHGHAATKPKSAPGRIQVSIALSKFASLGTHPTNTRRNEHDDGRLATPMGFCISMSQSKDTSKRRRRMAKVRDAANYPLSQHNSSSGAPPRTMAIEEKPRASLRTQRQTIARQTRFRM